VRVLQEVSEYNLIISKSILNFLVRKKIIAHQNIAIFLPA